MLTDRRRFSCDGCAAAPRLQKLTGCFDAAPAPVAVIAGFEFTRCPMASFGASEEYVGGLARFGTLKRAGVDVAFRMPAKLFAALKYCEDYLLRLEASDGN